MQVKCHSIQYRAIIAYYAIMHARKLLTQNITPDLESMQASDKLYSNYSGVPATSAYNTVAHAP